MRVARLTMAAGCLEALATVAAAPTPTVVWASDPVQPDETVIVQGGGFGREPAVDVRCASDGETVRVEPVQAADQCLKFVIPHDWPMGLYTVRVGAGERWSLPVTLNAPDVWWLQGDRGAAAATAGGWLRLFGKCLSSDSGSQVRLVPADGPPILLQPTSESCYALAAKLPDPLSDGTYTVLVHNGLGGDDPWREAGSMQILPPRDWSQDVFDVSAFREGAADDTAAIRAALVASEANGGGIVHLPRGRYTVTQTLTIPRFTLLRGESRELVSLRWPDREDPLPALIRGANSFAVEDLTLYANNHMHGILAERGRRADAGNVRVRRVRIGLSRFLGVSGRRFKDWRAEAERRTNQEGRVAAIQLGGDSIEVSDCDIYTSSAYTWGSTLGLIIDRGRGCVIARNRIDGPPRTAVIVKGGRGFIVEDNDIRGGCFLGTHHTPGDDFGGGGSLINTHFQDFYCARNRMHHNIWWDREILGTDSHGPAGAFVGRIREAAGTRLLLDSESGTWSNEAWRTGDAGWGTRWRAAAVYIMDGPGAGQYRRTVGGQGAEVIVDRAWDIVPDVSSRISIAKFHGRNLWIENEFEDCGNVFFWGSGIDSIVAGNRARRFGCFLTTTGYIYKGLQPTWYIQFLDNEILEGSGSWGGASKFGIVTYPMPLREPVYDGPLSRGCLLRRNTCHNNSFIDVSGATVDALVERCTVRQSEIGITITPRGEASPQRILLRRNTIDGAVTPVSGEAVDGAQVLP